jgi:hypothetical protein
MHNETLSVAAVRVNNPDRSPVGVGAASEPSILAGSGRGMIGYPA